VRTLLLALGLLIGVQALAQSALIQQVMNMSPGEREALMRQYGISPADLGIGAAAAAPGGSRPREESAGEAPTGVSPGLPGMEGLLPQEVSPAERELRRFLILQRLADAERDRQDPGFATVDYARRYGLGVFRGGTGAEAQQIDSLPVPDGYPVGPGDVLLVSLYGTESRQYYLEVQREGWIDLPSLGPIAVAGSTLAEARAAVRAKVQAEMIGVEASVTLDSLKSIQITVTGEVARPGLYVVPSLASVVNVLSVAGGPTDVGSLRQLRLLREGDAQEIDLYADLVFGAHSSNLSLRAGDTLHVPPLAGAAEVAGAVRRPAVYEILPGESLADLVTMAGGLRPGAAAKNAVARRYRRDGSQEVVTVALDTPEGRATSLGDGLSLRVPLASDFTPQVVELRGEVTAPGFRQWRAGLRVLDLLPDPQRDLIIDRADLEMALIVRRDLATQRLSFHPFTFASGASGELPANPLLEAGDTVLVFALPGVVERQRELEETERVARDELIDGLGELADSDLPIEPDLVQQAMSVLRTSEVNARSLARAELLEPYLSRVRVQPRDGSEPPIVRVIGQVREPGEYPLMEGAELITALRIAGGVTEQSDLHSAVVLRAETPDSPLRVVEVDVRAVLAGTQSFELASGDLVTVRTDGRVAERLEVTIDGEVASPGTYTLPAGSTLADLITLAGGVTDRADLRGAVFSRARLRQLETEIRNSYVENIRTGLINASVAGDTRTAGPAALQLLNDLQDSLEAEPVGRLQIDLARLALGEESADMRLLDGDRLRIPPFVNAVSVVGQVRMPGSFTLDDGMSVGAYVEMAGGLSEYADDDAIFVVRGNGRVEAVTKRGLQGRGRERIALLPGDRIVVPIKYDYIRPFDLTRDVVQIMYQTGIGLAAVLALFRN
jgi:protein involved in polysaccharide export with SLBB domain